MSSLINIIGSISRSVPNFKGKDFLGRNLLKRFIKGKEVESTVNLKGGGKLICPIEDWVAWNIYFHGKYVNEERYAKFMLDTAKGKQVIFDVGANIGYYTVLFATNTGGKVYAFEPMSYQYSVLNRNIAINQLQNVESTKNIVSDSDENKRIYFSGHDNSGGSSLEKVTTEFEDVPSITLDRFCEKNNIGSIDIIKIDVEGHELSVLKGMSLLLSNKKIEHLFVEIHDGNLQKAGASSTELCNYLEKYGYKSYSIKTGVAEKYTVGNDESLVYFTLGDLQIN